MKVFVKERPNFPKKVVVTAGMPYGSKELHFGHIGGVFVHADVYARFMRDRIGADNVIFVSGTDCYGSPIIEKYRQISESGEFSGSVIDFVESNHKSQKDTLDNYHISLNLFGASGLGASGKMHTEYSAELFNELYDSGSLKLMSTKQFYDESMGVYLNGRQVQGRCPIDGCKSEQAYADECSLGHQYFPDELIAPVSTLSGNTPVLKEVKNWYLDMEQYAEYLKELNDNLIKTKAVRQFIGVNCDEFLKPPMLYVKEAEFPRVAELLSDKDIVTSSDKGRKLVKIAFKKLSDREESCKTLANAGIRYRTGKTIVPFRISGNVEWGAPVPEKDGMKGLTFWVWPESLWAPISFTKTVLAAKGQPEDSWHEWWCREDSKVVQFIGEDNIYFYSLAEMAIFKAMEGGTKGIKIVPPSIVANKHILFFDKKASSSGAIKPPMAHELLAHYSAEQLRAHFLALGLHNANVPFQPKPYNPDKESNQGDPVFKEWGIFTNLLNRAVRTTFYSFQKYNEGNQTLPNVAVSSEILEKCEAVILKHERHMAKCEFTQVMTQLEDFFRYFNKDLSAKMATIQKEFNQETFNQTIVDAVHIMKTAIMLAHPIAPASTEKVRQALNIDDRIYSWDYAFSPITAIVGDTHKLNFIEARRDFFSRPEWQY
ncbi:MAG: class I tRNA ligase family protein [Bacillota bacterium]